jgi:hypothetical protein
MRTPFACQPDAMKRRDRTDWMLCIGMAVAALGFGALTVAGWF